MKTNPVIFIHGLWLHGSSWQPWQEKFESAGYATSAPGWPGDHDTVEATRADPDSVADKGIEDVTSHYIAAIDLLPEPPIIVGHSFGGMIAEKLLGLGYGAAAIAIDAAQIKGVLPLPLSSLRSTLPVFKNPANKHRAVSLTAEQFRYSFGNAIDEDESNQLYERWTIPSPGKPLFEAAVANFSIHSPAKVDTDNATAAPCCWSWAARTIPSPKPSPSPHSSSTVTTRPRPISSSSPTEATHLPSTTGGPKSLMSASPGLDKGTSKRAEPVATEPDSPSADPQLSHDGVGPSAITILGAARAGSPVLGRLKARYVQTGR